MLFLHEHHLVVVEKHRLDAMFLALREFLRDCDREVVVA
jgi:hypothetical protein